MSSQIKEAIVSTTLGDGKYFKPKPLQEFIFSFSLRHIRTWPNALSMSVWREEPLALHQLSFRSCTTLGLAYKACSILQVFLEVVQPRNFQPESNT